LHKDEEEGRKGGGKPVQEEEQGIMITATGYKNEDRDHDHDKDHEDYYTLNSYISLPVGSACMVEP
jgi:hypothetical protein